MDALTAARRCIRALSAERREIEKEQNATWAILKQLSSTFVDTLENLESVCEIFQNVQGAEALAIMVEQAWEQIAQTGVDVNGKVGEVFDPRWHRIIKEVPRPGVAPPHVLSVARRGISCLGRSVRPAEVVVEIPLSRERGEE